MCGFFVLEGHVRHAHVGSNVYKRVVCVLVYINQHVDLIVRVCVVRAWKLRACMCTCARMFAACVLRYISE